MKNTKNTLLLVLLGTLAGGAAVAAPVVHTSDFIADATRTNFNGFEGIPNDGTFYTGGAGPYVEDGVSVEQVNGDPAPDIWVAFNPPGKEGQFSWYPNGGDFGYTQITRAGGIDFTDVGMLVGSGFGSDLGLNLAFELWDDGVMVLSGMLANTTSTMPMGYLGFSGGGFDTIRLRDGFGPFQFDDGGANALHVDSIELARGGNTVPEPGTLALLAIAGLAGAATRRRR